MYIHTLSVMGDLRWIKTISTTYVRKYVLCLPQMFSCENYAFINPLELTWYVCTYVDKWWVICSVYVFTYLC